MRREGRSRLTPHAALVHWLRLPQPRVDPFVAAVGPGLAFPDRRDLLQSVDEPAAGFKSLVAVGTAHGDDHADLAQVEVADPMDDGDLDDWPALACFLLELGQLLHRHFG